MASSDERPRLVKVVVTGPFSAGKTTFIRSVSDVTALGTERAVSDETRSRKASTTVAMDHGRIRVDERLVLGLFGTPGQDRFEFMWDVLSEGMLGYVLVVDGSAPDPAGDALSVATAFRQRHPAVPCVVAVNRCGMVDAAGLLLALDYPMSVPVVPVDARDRASVKTVLLTLLGEVAARPRAAV